jgi:alpha-tubulin suppressor-like RCC1 family protein
MAQLWQWGSNYYGQLGNNQTGNNVFEPQQLTTTYNIVNIYNSEENSVILTNDNKVYTVGTNGYGQLGIGNTTSKSTFQPPNNLNLEKIGSVSIGDNFILLIIEPNKIFGAGILQYGLPSNAPGNYLGFTQITNGVPDNILNIDSGSSHSALLYAKTDDLINKIKTTGNNANGQLGNQTYVDEKNNFVDVVFENNIVQPSIYSISCGGYHTCVITNLNNIYSTGLNDKGQLGLGNNANVNEFTKVNNSFLETGESIKQISCSYYNTTLLTSNGRIFITGSNSFGQLGNPENNPSSSNTFIEINTTNVTNIGFTSISTGCLGQSVFAIKSENPCFSEGTKILCYKQLENSLICILKEEYRLVQHLKIGDLVKSYLHGYRKVSRVLKGKFVNNPKDEGVGNCMYIMKKTHDNGLIEDLTLTRNHGVLVEKLSENEEEKIDKNNLQIIDNLLSIITADSDKFEKVLDTNVYKYYHFSLDGDGDNDRRFGVWANGILVETPSNNMMDGALNIKPLDF